METAIRVLSGLVLLLPTVCGVFYLYQLLLALIGLLKKYPRYEKAEPGSIALLICAWNEEAVIGDLLDCINRQDYPKDKLKTFVVADHCTDRTADLARERGAVVYEKDAGKDMGKGYALSFLMESLRLDYPEGFDGYLVIDADNLLNTNFVQKMNDAMCAGNDVVTSFRNSKNYGANWVSAGDSLWFLCGSRFINHGRAVCGLSGIAAGTGFLFSRRIAEELEGWHYVTLTEDMEFSADMKIRGIRIGYCGEAELYDEQPESFSQTVFQRLRWTRGYFDVMRLRSSELWKGTFRGKFSCFDFLMLVLPVAVVIPVGAVLIAVLLILGGICGAEFWTMAWHTVVFMLAHLYVDGIICGIFIVFAEWKRIRATTGRKLLSIFTFPAFMATFIPIVIVAFFWKPKWVKIAHHGIREGAGSVFTEVLPPQVSKE